MRIVGLSVLLLCLLTASVAGGGVSYHKYNIGLTYGVGNLKAPEKPYFSFNHTWGVSAGISGDRGVLVFSILNQRNYNDSGASCHCDFFSDKDLASRRFSALRAGFDFDYYLVRYRTLCPMIGAGLGYSIWKYMDPVGDTVVQAVGVHGNAVDFSASEMYISGSLGLMASLSPRLSLTLKTSVDYLTGLGTSFNGATNDQRARMLMRATLTASYWFGPETFIGARRERPSSEAWQEKGQKGQRGQPIPSMADADNDGVADSLDRCPGTPLRAIVDERGCPVDSDGDGIADIYDDCPKTPSSAAGMVDLFGCPIDTDYDGAPDYRDSCRSGPIGAIVDSLGCPIDSDSDGVYDGLDDCPGTEAGIEVDARGCIDMSFLRDTLRIYIDYVPGSFEVDDKTKERLQPLIRKLKILDKVRIQICGYSDNIGPTEANQALSQKRANRMRDWLETQGIARERMTPVGKGEINFVSSNETAEGRAQNRRLEFIFSY
jgi:OmpA family/Thrombospondin type 3 repeat